MNEVQVFFVGMCMWWLTAPGPWVLLPDLENEELKHVATISAAPEAFVTRKCPSRFTLANGRCTFQLNGAGAAGGVRISFLTNTPPSAAEERPFCAVPPLQRTTLYHLKPAFTPPDGVSNAAWMQVIGGKPRSGMFQCNPEGGDNCPRFVQWSVASLRPGNIVLALDHLSTGEPILAELAPGAEIVISNAPPARPAAKRHQHREDKMDWCFYFRMVTDPEGAEPPCETPPAIPLPCPGMVSPPRVPPEGVNFQTVACSNSTYP